MGSDLRLKLKVGSGTPAREIRHKGTCLILIGKSDRSSGCLREDRTVLLGNRDGGNMIRLTHRHKDIALYVIVDDTRSSTCQLCLQSLILKCIFTTAYQGDLALQLILGEGGVICLHTNAGNSDVFKGL